MWGSTLFFLFYEQVLGHSTPISLMLLTQYLSGWIMLPVQEVKLLYQPALVMALETIIVGILKMLGSLAQMPEQMVRLQD